MLLITLVLVLLFFLIYKRHQQMSIFKRIGIPGPRPNFIFGNSFELASGGVNGVFPKWTQKYGQIVGFYIGGRPQVLTTDFELLRHVLIKDFHIFSNRSQCVPGGIHPQPQLQKMLIWTEDNMWRQLRATLSPSFSRYKLNAMEPLMMKSIDNMLDELNHKAKPGREIDVRPLTSELTFSVAAKCIFSLNLSLNKYSDEAKNFFETAHPGLENSMLAMVMVLFPSLTFIAHPLRVLWERFRLYMLWSAEGFCYDVAKKIVHGRRNTKLKSNDFLQLLINAKRIKSTSDKDLEMLSEDVSPNINLLSKDTCSEDLTEEEIVSNAMLFQIASLETTAVTLQFIIHNLVNNQDIQEKLRNELRNALEDGNNDINLATVSKVPLLNNVIKETMRMFPPVSPFMTRVASEDYEYRGVVIPKGTGVFIGVPAIHNNPELWPQPETFRPERFDSEFDKLAYLPFGAGPRNCIGMRFAYMEVQLAVANLILKYRFEPGPSTEKKIETVESFATLRPKNGVFCKVTRLLDL